MRLAPFFLHESLDLHSEVSSGIIRFRRKITGKGRKRDQETHFPAEYCIGIPCFRNGKFLDIQFPYNFLCKKPFSDGKCSGGTLETLLHSRSAVTVYIATCDINLKKAMDP